MDLPPGIDAALVEVADPLIALGDLAAWWRGRHAVRVVGITGSTGKTLAKEVVADVLARTESVLRNEGNLNSESGLPLTLLRLTDAHRIAVLEMSMYTEGEIARLAEIARPEVGIVLNVQPMHLMRAGSIEAIARAKGELPAALPSDGLAILNADDPRVAAMAAATAASVLTFGLAAGADVRATELVGHGLAGTSFILVAPWGSRRLHLAMPGRHLVPHALAAAAVAERFGTPLDEVEAALAAGSHAAHRMAPLEAASGATLIDDTYNAAPWSVAGGARAAWPRPPWRPDAAASGARRHARARPDEERRTERSGAWRRRIVDGLVAVGPRGRWIADAARAAGLAHGRDRRRCGRSAVADHRA